MLRVAMLSKWHVHAGDYANQISAVKDCKITAVWDEQSERGENWAKELGVPFIAKLGDLLKRDDVDAVIIDTPTNMHCEVMIAAANAGKHIFTEKVMALTVKECNAIKEAVLKNNVKFCISFPHRTNPQNLFAKKVVDENTLGEITLMRVRNAHNGASAGWLPPHFYNPIECGGGAMIDLGAHPMYLSRWLLGKPAKITSMFNSYTNKPVEDNAISVIEFKNKAVSIVETGFISSHSPFSLELYGTCGSLFIGGPENKVQLMTQKDGFVQVTQQQLPEALPSAIIQWVDGIINNKPIEFGLDEGIQLTELMEGAYKSYNESRMVSFTEL